MAYKGCAVRIVRSEGLLYVIRDKSNAAGGLEHSCLTHELAWEPVQEGGYYKDMPAFVRSPGKEGRLQSLGALRFV